MRPEFLGDIREILRLALGVGVMGFLFMLVYEPFDLAELYAEFRVSGWLVYAIFGVLVTVWVFVLGVGFRRMTPHKSLSLKDYLLFAVITAFTLSVILFLVHEPVSQIPTAGWTDYFTVLRYTLLVLVIPFFLLGTYYFRKGVTAITKPGDQMLHLKDDQERVKLSVRIGDVLYFESTDNYVTVFMNSEKGIRKQLIRTTLKRIRSEVPAGVFIQSNRSTVVNRQFISSVEQKSGNVLLHVKGLKDPFRVSRSMKKDVLNDIQGTTIHPK